MTFVQAFLNELKAEAETTKKILELVPMDKADWKPHEKSMELLRLASHVAEIPGYAISTLTADELDFTKFEYKPFIPDSKEALLEHLAKNVKNAQDAFNSVSDDDLSKPWTMRSGEQIFFTLCKLEVLRSFVFNHWVHHRAQLGVYLRLQGIPLPGSYGPTADGQ